MGQRLTIDAVFRDYWFGTIAMKCEECGTMFHAEGMLYFIDIIGCPKCALEEIITMQYPDKN